MDIYYNKKFEQKAIKGQGLKPISKQKALGLKPIKGSSCKKIGKGLVILQ